MKKSVFEKHPYLLSLLICLGIWSLSFGDQRSFSGTAVIIVAFLIVTVLFKKFILNDSPQYLKFSLSAFGTAVGAFVFYLAPYKGSIILLSALLFLLVSYLIYKKQIIQSEQLNFLIVAFAFVLYISYILYTTYTQRQLDVGRIYIGSGHLAYVRYLYEHWLALPDFDPREVIQMYHPPLHYMLSAILIRMATSLGIDYTLAVESVQIVSLYGAMCTLITSYKIFKEFNISGYPLSCALSLTAFANSLVIMSGTFSNDMLSITFETASVYCTLKWYKNRDLKTIIQIALCIGFGMMSKISVAVAAPPIAFIFIYSFFKDLKNFKRYISQFLVFLLISVPIALWFPVKNLILFGIPLGYVPQGAYSEFIENIPVWKRLFDFSGQHFQYPISARYGVTVFGVPCSFEDYNPLIALIKSSVDLQNMSYETPLKTIFYCQFWITAVIGVTAFVYMVYSLFSKKFKGDIIKKIFMTLFYFTIMTSYYIFCIKYPNIHAENIRYVFDVVIIGSLYIGLLLKQDFKSSLMKYFKKFLYALVISYTAMSLLVWVAVSFEYPPLIT